MNLKAFRDRFRGEEKDDVLPYLWSDDQLNTWINEAQDEACRRALLLVDSTSAAAKVTYAAGAVGIDLHPSVIFVRRATLASSNLPLTPRVSRTMDEEIPGWEGAQASVPRVFVPDWQTNYLRFWPPALAGDTVNMSVVRVPLDPMVADTDEPEIRPQYHAYMLDWVKARAYRVQDSEVYNKDKADKFEASFIKQFGESAAVFEHWALEQYYDVGAR